MRTILTSVVGVVSFCVVVASAMAEQPGMAIAEQSGVAIAEQSGVAIAEQPGTAIAEQAASEQAIQPTRFVAPEPTAENRAAATRQTAPRKPNDLLPIGFAEAADDVVEDVAGDPLAAKPDPIPAKPDPTSLDDTGYAYASDNNWVDYCDDPYCRRCGGSGRAGRRLIGSTCTMGQRHAYFPPMHGYYYFHPYHHSHVREHQTFAQLWGEDPANPYSNRLFQTVYQHYRDETAREQPVVEP